MALLEKAQDLVAHAVAEKKWAKLITYLAQKEIKRRVGLSEELRIEGKKAKPKGKMAKNPGGSGGKEEHQMTTAERNKFQLMEKEGSFNIFRMKNARKVLPLTLQKQIRQKYDCCQYRDPQSQKQCGSKRFLEIDHLQPVWAGGGNESENLTLLCSQHNKHKYAKEVNLHPLRW